MSLHPKFPVISFALAGILVAAASAPALLRATDLPHDQSSPPVTAPSVTAAVAVLLPTQGNDVHGIVHFTKVAGGVRVVAEVSGLTPGEHGFHIHEFGDASSADGTAAGGHFNPTHEHHAGPMAEHRHAGDLGNLKADASGHASLDYVDAKLSLEGPASIIGRGVIIHTGADDFTTQPTGNAGKRAACGVIGLAKGA